MLYHFECDYVCNFQALNEVKLICHLRIARKIKLLVYTRHYELKYSKLVPRFAGQKNLLKNINKNKTNWS